MYLIASAVLEYYVFYILVCFTVKQSLEQCLEQAGHKRNWSTVRYSSSLLKQMIDSISPYITQILVSGTTVTVGTIGRNFTSFDKPPTPAAVYEAIYTNVQPYNIISAVLQQELILYCGKLIASKPELFSGLLVVRMGYDLFYKNVFSGTRTLEIHSTSTFQMAFARPGVVSCNDHGRS